MSKLIAFVVGVFFAALAASCTSLEAPSAEDAPKPISEVDMFAALESLGMQKGSAEIGKVDTAAGGYVLVIRCQQKGLQAIFSPDLAPFITRPPRIDVKYEFYLCPETLRLNVAHIWTNLQPSAASANVRDSFLQEHAPRSDYVLEFEVLLSTYFAEKGSPAKTKIMIRSRMVYFYDDPDIGYGDTFGTSWVYEAPVFAPDGENSAQAAVVSEVRSYYAWPWNYTLADFPPDVEVWWSDYYQRSGGNGGKPSVLTLVRGQYAPQPDEWPLLKYKREGIKGLMKSIVSEKEKTEDTGNDPG